MTEISLTRLQLAAFLDFLKEQGHTGEVGLEEGEFGPGYLTATLINSDGRIYESRTWSVMGESPRPDAIPPSWKAEDEKGHSDDEES